MKAAATAMVTTKAAVMVMAAAMAMVMVMATTMAAVLVMAAAMAMVTTMAAAMAPDRRRTGSPAVILEVVPLAQFPRVDLTGRLWNCL